MVYMIRMPTKDVTTKAFAEAMLSTSFLVSGAFVTCSMFSSGTHEYEQPSVSLRQHRSQTAVNPAIHFDGPRLSISEMQSSYPLVHES